MIKYNIIVGASKKNLLFIVYLQRIEKAKKSSFRIVLSSANFWRSYAPINVNPVGGSAGKGWGFDKF